MRGSAVVGIFFIKVISSDWVPSITASARNTVKSLFFMVGLLLKYFLMRDIGDVGSGCILVDKSTAFSIFCVC
jgi:hypothetical protein